MSTKAVIVWLFLAIILGTAVVFVVFFPKGCAGPASSASTSVPVGSRLLEFTPGDVRQIVVESPADNLVQTIEPAPKGKGPFGADADWQLRTQPLAASPAAPSQAAEPWPLDSSQIQTLIRILSETRSVAPAAADATLGTKPTKVTLQLREGASTWTLADRSLGGTGLVEVSGPGKDIRRAVVRDDLHRLFTEPGPRAWRVPFPLAGIAPDASRIRLESTTTHLALSRISGKWNLIEPAASPADPAAVQRLIAELGRVQIVDFLDSSSAASPQVEKPVATIRIEADRRTVDSNSAEPKVSTDSVELAIGNAVGSSRPSAGPRVLASINALRPVHVDGRTVAMESDPATYIWPAPLRESPSNIGGFSLTFAISNTPGRAFKRFGTKWSQSLVGGGEAPVSDNERRGVEEVLAFLTGDHTVSKDAQPQPRPTITFAAPADSRSIASLRVDTLSGDPLETLEVLADGADKVCVRTGRVWRTYGAGTVPVLLSSAVEASRATDPATKR